MALLGYWFEQDIKNGTYRWNKNEEIKRNDITLYHATLVFSNAFCCGNHTFLALYGYSSGLIIKTTYNIKDLRFVIGTLL